MTHPAFVVFLAAVSLALLVACALLFRRYRTLQARYGPVLDINEAVRQSSAELERLRAQAAAEFEEHNKQRGRLTDEYDEATARCEQIRRELAVLEENLEDISVGLYEPHYHYDSSDQYRAALDGIRENEKHMVREGRAVVARMEWQVRGNKREGERMTKQYQKLMLRAFNGECDAAVAKVAWNNVTKMDERVRKAFEAVNDLGNTMQMSITPDYLDLKLAELRLEYETEQKKHDEMEEQRRIRTQMREEERALREAEKAKADAEADEARYQQALDKARAEMAQAQGEKLGLLNLKIQQLDAALQKAREMKEKATTMARLTRSGHVYVISNIGSFGEDVFKIGMTRRLVPEERVDELGDASVPFDFDIHAMIYSTDAPTLEAEIQARFRDSAVNLVNPRKEFYRASIAQIAAVVEGKGLNIQLTKLAEAREYRQTLSLRASKDGRAGEIADVQGLHVGQGRAPHEEGQTEGK
jgi:hypothetical protein